MTTQEILAAYAKEMGWWNGGDGYHRIVSDTENCWCEICGKKRIRDRNKLCPGPNYKQNTDMLLRMAESLSTSGWGEDVALWLVGGRWGCMITVESDSTGASTFGGHGADWGEALLAAIVAALEARG